jgi:phosphohistidine swiveling domain-containing protein
MDVYKAGCGSLAPYGIDPIQAVWERGQYFKSYTLTEEWERLGNDLGRFVDTHCELVEKKLLYLTKTTMDEARAVLEYLPHKLENVTPGEKLRHWYDAGLMLYPVNLAPLEHAIEALLKATLPPNAVTALPELLRPSRQTFAQKAEEALLDITLEHYDNLTPLAKPWQHPDVSAYIDKYQPYLSGYGDEVSITGYVAQLLAQWLRDSRENLAEKKAAMNSRWSHQASEQENLFARPPFSDVVHVIRLARLVGEWRDERKAILGQFTTQRNRIAEAIAPSDWRLLGLDELVDGKQLSETERVLRRTRITIVDQYTLTIGDDGLKYPLHIVTPAGFTLTGEPVSLGQVAGRVTTVQNPEAIQEIEDLEILVTQGTDFNFIGVLRKAKGVITEEGGLLSHAAVICREYGTPCIVGVKGATRVLRTGDWVEINAHNGLVEIIKSKPAPETKSHSREKDTCDLAVLEPEANAKLGMKAWRLAIAQHAGWRVPESIVIPAAVVKWLASHQMSLSDLEVKARVIEALLSTMRGKELLDAIEGKIVYPLVVRSSGAAEDQKRASFAGVFQSHLNIWSRNELILAIASCIASYTRSDVEIYAAARGLQGVQLGSVLIQKMLHPLYSGVAFTVNPVTVEDQIVVEYTEGTAEAILMGGKTPKRLVLTKDESLTAPCSESTVEPFSRMLHRLVAMATSLEKLFEEPQDIEWAFADDQLYLLQTRPVTGVSIGAA